jgi:C4-dicarboxylate-specific signal transduction histidine kinase
VEFLRAIDWALKLRPDERPQDVAELRRALFASHAGALGLEEALRRHEDDGFLAATESWATVFSSRKLLHARLHRFWRAAGHPASWPMAVKMTLAMVATALAPMIVTAYYNLQVSREHVAAVEIANLEQIAQSTAGRISQVLSDSRNLADYVGGDEDFVQYMAKPDVEGTRSILMKLEGLTKSYPDIQFAMVMDPKGTALVATDPQVMGKNFKFREYFKEAMDGRAYMSGIIVGSVAGAAGVFYSRPILDAMDHVLGVVVVRIKAEPISRILAGVRIGDDDRVPFLVDGDGVIVWHPDEKIMFKSLMPLSRDQIKEIAADQRFRRATIQSLDQVDLAKAMVGGKERGSVTYVSSVTKRQEIAGFSPVPTTDWVVGVSESRDYFAAPLDRLFQKVLMSVALAGVIFVGLALIFARSIVRPIERLTAAAHALKSGAYDKATVEVRSNDELGQLARTFNVMIDVLRQRERERAAARRGTAGEPGEPGADKPEP